MDINQIIGFGGAAVTLGVGLFFTESIKHIVQQFFTKRSKGEIDTIFYVILIFTVSIFIGIGSFGIDDQKNKPDIIENQSESNRHPEADYVEAGKEVYDIASEAIADKKYRDSTYLANREKLWAFQIGTIKKEDAAWDLYGKVKHIEGICFFKVSRREYLVIKYNGSFKEEDMEQTLNSFAESIDSLGEKVQKIDLMSYCSKKEKVVEQKKIRNRKLDYEVRLYECEK